MICLMKFNEFYEYVYIKIIKNNKINFNFLIYANY